MLSNAYLLAKIGADTAENERIFAKILAARGAAGGPRSVGCRPSLPAESGRGARRRRDALRPRGNGPRGSCWMRLSGFVRIDTFRIFRHVLSGS
jgi:hypothetical protein